MPTSRPRSTWSLLARLVLLAGLAGLIVACGGDGDETAGGIGHVDCGAGPSPRRAPHRAAAPSVRGSVTGVGREGD
jgi:hypothetical protein